MLINDTVILIMFALWMSVRKGGVVVALNTETSVGQENDSCSSVAL